MRGLRARHPLAGGYAPSWATQWGQDRLGGFVEVRVGDAEYRLRWIPPGRFDIGSPESESGRFDRETRHEVMLTRGYWLGETPVTQQLWVAVMDQNPSEFRSVDRPVDGVSFEDVERFLSRLEERVPGLGLRLPTEAEWERACRAGTLTSTYAGDAEIVGENNAPLLDGIAWYGGNSGVDFDLETGLDSSGWPEKQFAHARAGTRSVRRKRPNAFGLYDMLGNVYEWCGDWFAPFDERPVIDPTGAVEGPWRVLRGGSWYSLAQFVRAAYRDVALPGHRPDLFGFRLARGQSAPGPEGAPAERAEEAAEPPSRSGAPRG